MVKWSTDDIIYADFRTRPGKQFTSQHSSTDAHKVSKTYSIGLTT